MHEATGERRAHPRATLRVGALCFGPSGVFPATALDLSLCGMRLRVEDVTLAPGDELDVVLSTDDLSGVSDEITVRGEVVRSVPAGGTTCHVGLRLTMVEPSQRGLFAAVIEDHLGDGVRIDERPVEQLVLHCGDFRQLRGVLRGIVSGSITVRSGRELGLNQSVDLRVVHPVMEQPMDLDGCVTHLSGTDPTGSREVSLSVECFDRSMVVRAEQILLGLELPTAA